MGLNISTFIPTGWKMGLTNNLYWADLDLEFGGWRVLNMYVFTKVSFNINIGPSKVGALPGGVGYRQPGKLTLHFLILCLTLTGLSLLINE